MRRAIPVISLLPAVLLAACAGQAPDLSVSEAYVAQRTDAAAVVNVVVKAQNPTKDALPMWAIAYGSAQRAPGMDSIERWAQATVPAGGTVVFELPVVVPAQASGTSNVGVTATVNYVPGGKLRELLNELSYPLPTTSFSGSVPVDWSAPPRAPKQLRPGTVQTATVTDPGPVKVVDTLPPLQPPAAQPGLPK